MQRKVGHVLIAVHRTEQVRKGWMSFNDEGPFGCFCMVDQEVGPVFGCDRINLAGLFVKVLDMPFHSLEVRTYMDEMVAQRGLGELGFEL